MFYPYVSLRQFYRENILKTLMNFHRSRFLPDQSCMYMVIYVFIMPYVVPNTDLSMQKVDKSRSDIVRAGEGWCGVKRGDKNAMHLPDKEAI